MGRVYIWPVCQYLSVWKVFPLHTDPLTDQTVRQNFLGPDCKWGSHGLDGHMVAQCSGSLDVWAYEVKAASGSQYLLALVCICPETRWVRAYRWRVLGLLILREEGPKMAEPLPSMG